MKEPKVKIRVTIHPTEDLDVTLSEAESLVRQGIVVDPSVFTDARANHEAGKEAVEALALIERARRDNDRARAASSWPSIVGTLTPPLRTIAERHSPDGPDDFRCGACVNSYDFEAFAASWPCPDAIDILNHVTGETWNHLAEE